MKNSNQDLIEERDQLKQEIIELKKRKEKIYQKGCWSLTFSSIWISLVIIALISISVFAYFKFNKETPILPIEDPNESKLIFTSLSRATNKIPSTSIGGIWSLKQHLYKEKYQETILNTLASLILSDDEFIRNSAIDIIDSALSKETPNNQISRVKSLLYGVTNSSKQGIIVRHNVNLNKIIQHIAEPDVSLHDLEKEFSPIYKNNQSLSDNQLNLLFDKNWDVQRNNPQNQQLSFKLIRLIVQKWLATNSLIIKDKKYLINTNLSNTNLNGIDFSNADLRNASLINTKLLKSNFEYANLQWANLSKADIRSSNLFSIDLRNAKLEMTDLRNSNLWSANLKNANLELAKLQGTNLRDVQLQNSKIGFANFTKANLENASILALDKDKDDMPIMHFANVRGLNVMPNDGVDSTKFVTWLIQDQKAVNMSTPDFLAWLKNGSPEPTNWKLWASKGFKINKRGYPTYK